MMRPALPSYSGAYHRPASSVYRSIIPFIGYAQCSPNDTTFLAAELVLYVVCVQVTIEHVGRTSYRIIHIQSTKHGRHGGGHYSCTRCCVPWSCNICGMRKPGMDGSAAARSCEASTQVQAPSAHRRAAPTKLPLDAATARRGRCTQTHTPSRHRRVAIARRALPRHPSRPG